ncbi:MAG: hypothetical protein ACLFR7_06930 [Opitutales bacterium]
MVLAALLLLLPGWGGVAGLALADPGTRLERGDRLPGAPEPPERRVIRGPDGSVGGSADGSVARDNAGTATGSVRSDPDGRGSVTRETDGTLRGVQPGEARIQRFEPRRP